MQGDANKSARHDANTGRVTHGAAAMTQIPLQFAANDANDGRDGAFRTERADREPVTQQLQESDPNEPTIRLMFFRKHGSCVVVR